MSSVGRAQERTGWGTLRGWSETFRGVRVIDHDPARIYVTKGTLRRLSRGPAVLIDTTDLGGSRGST